MVTATVVTGMGTGMGMGMGMGTGMEATATLIKVVTGTATAMGTPTTITKGRGTVGIGTVAGGVMELADAGSGHHTDTNGFATERLKETGRSLLEFIVSTFKRFASVADFRVRIEKDYGEYRKQ